MFYTFVQVKRFIYLEVKVGEAYWEVRSAYTFSGFCFFFFFADKIMMSEMLLLELMACGVGLQHSELSEPLFFISSRPRSFLTATENA